MVHVSVSDGICGTGALDANPEFENTGDQKGDFRFVFSVVDSETVERDLVPILCAGVQGGIDANNGVIGGGGGEIDSDLDMGGLAGA